MFLGCRTWAVGLGFREPAQFCDILPGSSTEDVGRLAWSSGLRVSRVDLDLVFGWNVATLKPCTVLLCSQLP